MSEKEINSVIAKNLNRYLTQTGKTQIDLSLFMNVSQATVSNWCKGLKMPRMDKIDKICSFFNISRSDLMEEESDSTEPELNILKYYNKLNPVGKEEAEKRIEELTHIDKYTNTVELLNAAHEIPGATEEEKKHDDDIMDDENF